MSDNQGSIDHHSTDTVICPYCGHDNGGDDAGLTEGQMECRDVDCGKQFDCQPDWTVDYTTRKIPCWNEEPHSWSEPYFSGPNEKGHRKCRFCRKVEWVEKEVTGVGK